jgi:hypothetical protein
MGISFTDFTGGSAKQNNFAINVGSSGDTVFALDKAYDSGSYNVTIISNDTTFDIYAIAPDGSLCGYTNTLALETSNKFDKLVVLGLPSNDQLFFEFKGAIASADNSGSVTSAGAYVSSVSLASLKNIDDTTIVSGGNFANNVQVFFVGQSESETEAKSVIVNSTNEILVTRPDTLDPDDAPYSIRVANPNVPIPVGSNLFRLVNSVTAGTSPSWLTGNTLYYITDQENSFEVAASDTEDSEITYSIISGTLPSGLALNSANGNISGNFSGSANAGDGQDVTVRATDAGGNYVDKTFSLIASPRPVWSTVSGPLQSIPGQSVGQTRSLLASNLIGLSVSYSIVSGSLPDGMSLDSSTGIISGTPTSILEQDHTFTVRAEDSNGAFTNRVFSLLITPPQPQAFGGALSQDSTYYYRTFTSNETMTVAGYSLEADIFLVGGGGGGGTVDNIGGRYCGGGAGGYTTTSLSQSLSVGDYAVTVGSGGTGGPSGGGNGTSGIASEFAQIATANGGGYGGGSSSSGGSYLPGGDGGSGGGTASQAGFSDGAGGGSGPLGDGSNGGLGQGSTTRAFADPNGTLYAGGGGGGTWTFAAVGGAGGGGAGSSKNYNTGGGASNAQINTGGGGGGRTLYSNGGPAGNGGSGIVIVRYTKDQVD